MKKSNVFVLGIVFLLLMSVLAVSYYQANQTYQLKKQAYYLPKISTIQAFATQEKAWIRKNQSEQGHIYMNYSESETSAGDVNPYFASLAAQGLLAGEVTEADLQAVKAYLDWHIATFIEADGELADYTLDAGRLVISNQADSVDSYIAVFISLLHQYLDQGGIIAQTQYDQVIAIALAQLEALMSDGLTTINFDSDVIYLMDNLEVQAAYRDFLRVTEDEQLQAYLTDKITTSQTRIDDHLWNEQAARYEIGMNDDGTIIQTVDRKQLYPDAIVQIYHLAFNIDSKDDKHSKQLYKTFNDNITWDNLNGNANDEFFWSEIFYIAALMGDIEKAESYLAAYKQKVEQSREYPFHTATAGWASKAAAALEKEYENRLNKSLLHDFFARTIYRQAK